MKLTIRPKRSRVTVCRRLVQWESGRADDRYRLVFSGKKAVARVQVGDGDKETEKYTVKLDATVTPNQIDFTKKEGDEKEVRQGICKVEGDKLTLCVQTDDDRPRPTEFESKADDGRILVVLKRAKKKPKERKDREE